MSRSSNLYLFSNGLHTSGLSYPDSDGLANQVIVTDGNGNLSFANQSGGGGGGLDSSTTISLIDSAYVQARQTGFIALYQDGELEATTGTSKWYSPGNISITKISTRVSVSSNDTTSVLIKKNGTTQKTVNIAAAALEDIDSDGFDMNNGDYLTVDVASVGSTPSEDLNIQFLFTYK